MKGRGPDACPFALVASDSREPVTTAAGTPHHRAEVWRRCHQLVERAQVGSVEPELGELLEVVVRYDWPDLECLLHFARFAGTDVTCQDGEVVPVVDALAQAAERSGNDTMVALALATRATQLGVWTERDLPRAVALLDAKGGSAADRPLAYLICGIGYHRRGLWELSLDMLARASAALAGEWPTESADVVAVNRRAVTLNRTESMLPLTCALLEIDEAEQARSLARRRDPLTPAELAALPVEWLPEVQAVQGLLAAIAQEPETQGRPTELLRALHPTRRVGYRACVHLAEAIRAHDAGRRHDAAAHAEVAFNHVDVDFGPALTTICLKLAAAAEPDGTAWQRYAHRQAQLRWRARLDVVTASRAQLDAERVMLDSERLTERAYLDELTGLANRHSYQRHLSRIRADRADGEVAVIMVDVDHFKVVNDFFGHAVGDEVLRRLGAILRGITRQDDLAVRLGGDEFLVLCHITSEREILTQATDLVSGIAGHDWHELAEHLRVTVSAGLAVGTSAEVDELVRRADGHLYRAKSNGRARLMHDSRAH